jgi:predicted DNA-binding transcriptional regulator YafY
MEYFVPSREEVTRRSVDPLGLVYYSDHWNLIAFDHLRDEIRNFRLDRIKEMFVLSERFDRPADFDLEEHLKERGMASSAVPIVIRFSKEAYRRARVAIPARIESEEESDETVTVRFAFDNLDYLASWILRFGDAAEVREPETLRKKHLEAGRAISNLYT